MSLFLFINLEHAFGGKKKENTKIKYLEKKKTTNKKPLQILKGIAPADQLLLTFASRKTRSYEIVFVLTALLCSSNVILAVRKHC